MTCRHDFIMMLALGMSSGALMVPRSFGNQGEQFQQAGALD